MTRRRKPAEETLRQRAAASAGDRWQETLAEVAADLEIEPDSDTAVHVATMRLSRRSLLERLLRGERVDPDDLLKIDAALRQYQPARKAPQIRVQFVPGKVVCCPKCAHEFDPVSKEAAEPSYRFRARCSKCNQLHEYSNKPFDNAKPVEEPAPDKPTEPALTVAGYRGVSASPVHDSVLSNGEIAPLKKLQPSYDTLRNVSPMSVNGSHPAPRRDNAPAGSAMDEPNPNRKVS